MTTTTTTVPVVVVNPASAGGSTKKRWPELEAAIRRELGEFRAAFTSRVGHATELTRQALHEGARLVIAMGGDGTINEVANGFFAEGTHAAISPDAALGVLPSGTGGDFVKTTHTPRPIEEAARALAAGAARPIDIGRLTFVAHDGKEAVRHFINIASFGLSGLVDRFVNGSSKALGGKISFYIASLRASMAYTNARVRLTLDDQPAREQAIHTVAIANGRFFGGGMMIAPDALLDDGQLDVVTLGDVGFGKMVLASGKIYKGTHVALDWVNVARARRVRAEPLDGTDVLLDVDGEAPGRLPATFEILPGALRLHR